MDDLLNPAQAAARYGVSRWTARRRAVQAIDDGSAGVQRIGDTYAAPAAWWERALRLRAAGRPRKQPRPVDDYGIGPPASPEHRPPRPRRGA